MRMGLLALRSIRARDGKSVLNIIRFNDLTRNRQSVLLVTSAHMRTGQSAPCHERGGGYEHRRCSCWNVTRLSECGVASARGFMANRRDLARRDFFIRLGGSSPLALVELTQSGTLKYAPRAAH
jgi:hypothetical protein